MQNKLKANKNHFSIKELKIIYIESQVNEAAIKHIASWMRNTSLNLFLEVEEVLLIINKMYDDLNHHYTTQRQYLKLYQNKIFFHEFWMKFQRFNAELKYNNKILLNDLQHKISSDLQRAMLNEWITNLNEFVDICMWVDVRLTELNTWSVIKASKHQWLKLLDLSLAHRLLDSRHQSLHERNSEDQISILFRKSCLRKNSASNARS